jgi:hypothetical protein
MLRRAQDFQSCASDDTIAGSSRNVPEDTAVSPPTLAFDYNPNTAYVEPQCRVAPRDMDKMLAMAAFNLSPTSTIDRTGLSSMLYEPAPEECNGYVPMGGLRCPPTAVFDALPADCSGVGSGTFDLSMVQPFDHAMTSPEEWSDWFQF